ncbi:MAG: hypothetical protein FWH34_07690 [Desulfovibrionaceae bacterium]|nr:hypothetical protein [Desulfovibrionaceae bacterium]
MLGNARFFWQKIPNRATQPMPSGEKITLSFAKYAPLMRDTVILRLGLNQAKPPVIQIVLRKAAKISRPPFDGRASRVMLLSQRRGNSCA